MADVTVERCDGLITSLTEEIASLKEKFRENRRKIAFLSSDSVKDALESFHQDNIEGVTTRNVNTQLARGDTELKYFMSMSGIKISQSYKKTEKRGDEVVQSHTLVGRCRSIPFKVTFIATEAVQREGRWSCDVTHVKVHMDCKGNPELLKLVERTETTGSLLGFFQALNKYAEWRHFRGETFTQLKERYPDAVRLPYGSSGSTMVLVNPELPKCELVLVWEVTVTDRGDVLPLLDLLPKLPEEAIALDKTDVLEDAGPAFKNLLRVFGIPSSIEKIIGAFCSTTPGLGS